MKLKVTQLYLSLTIDERYSYRQRINGEAIQLRIKYGVYLGGQDTFKSLYLGNLKPLRGCIEEVIFNQKDLLKISRQHGIVHNVSPECDEQFAAIANTTISFVESNSFVVLPGVEVATNETKLFSVRFDLRTISNTAILLFSSSANSRRPFVALEVIEGKIKFSVNDGINEHNVLSSVSNHDLSVVPLYNQCVLCEYV